MSQTCIYCYLPILKKKKQSKKKKLNLIKEVRGSFHSYFKNAGRLFDANKCMRCQTM